MKLGKILALFVFTISISNAALLYQNPSYPIPSFGEQDNSWNTALESTLEGYKTRYITNFTSGLVHDPSRTADTVSASVSEATGYGLLIFLWGNKQTYFDALWTAAKAKQQKANYLFSWIQDKNGNVFSPTSATDAEQDIAMALIFADRLKKTGYSGWKDSVIDYGLEATKILGAIYQLEISNNYVYPDDLGFINPDFNPSYFSPAAYKVFSQFENSSTHNWKGVIDQGYAVMNANPGSSKGLAPDWCNFNGSIPSVISRNAGPKGNGTDFWYDAIRVPFRLALDSLWYNDSRAINFLDNAMSWIPVTKSRMADINGNWYMDIDTDPNATPNTQSWHNELTIGMWGAGAQGSSAAYNTKKSDYLHKEMAQFYLSPNAVGTDYFGTIWYTQARNEYFNQSLAWLGTGIMNGAAGDVYGDLSIASKVKTFNNPSMNVNLPSQMQLIVTDNDGWNNIKNVTINITDINLKPLLFIYHNDFGTRSFNSTTPQIISSSVLSYSGNQKILTFNISNLQLKITDNFWAGAITVSILCEDYQGNKHQVITRNQYINWVPTAQFTVHSLDNILPTINSVQDAITLSIVNYSDDDKINSFTWELGGLIIRNTSSRSDFNYTIPTSITGNTTVTLTITDYFNAQSRHVKHFWVNPLPIANLQISRLTMNIANVITFDCSLSSDDVTINAIILNYGDGSAPGNSFVSTHSYHSSGTQNVQLIIMDNYGGISEVNTQIYVNYKPSPDYQRVPLTANIGVTINVNASISWDDSHTTISTYEWYAPDLNQHKTGLSAKFNYPTPGSHELALRVTDSWGARGVITKTVYVNYPPTADFVFVTNNFYIPCIVTLNASVATDKDDAIIAWFWDFGDGSTGNGMIIGHYYTEPDTHNVSLLVVDKFGATDSITIPIKILSTVRINETYYASIQKAINAAVSGNTISIDVSKYGLPDYKENLIITKSLKIENESPSSKIHINGQGSRGIQISGNQINVELNDMIVSNSSANIGGGIYTNSHLILKNINIENAQANQGGGLYVDQTSIRMENCEIKNSVANSKGGAVYSNLSTAIVLNSIISNNTSYSDGGGLCLISSNWIISKNRFIKNETSTGYGGAISQTNGTTQVILSVLNGNQSVGFKGGAVAANQGNMILMNNLFTNNEAANHGGAVYVYNGYLKEINDTLIGNSGAMAGGLYSEYQSLIEVYNTVYYDNSPKDISIADNVTFLTINNTVAESWQTFLAVSKRNTSNFVLGVNPRLSPDYSLSAYSPFIDYGLSSKVSGVIFKDLNNNPRITNNAVDIGAFETFDNVPPILPVWININNHVTTNQIISLNANCSTDVYQIHLSGGSTFNTLHNLYSSSFFTRMNLNFLSRNVISLSVSDRAGNVSAIRTLIVTQDELPSPNLAITYTTSNYVLQAVFDARSTDPGSGVGSISEFKLFFTVGETTSNTSGLFNFIFADLIDQQITLQVIDNYGLKSSVTININPPTYFIPNKLNLMSFPMTFSGNIAEIFNTTNIKIWLYDVALSPTYNQPALSSHLKLGEGYWVRAPNGTSLASITRSYLPMDQQYSISLNAGWNLLGTPYAKNLDFSKVYFKDGSTIYSQAAAFSNGLIFNNQVWGFDRSISPNAYAPYYLTSNIKIWKGYWLYTIKDLELIITESAVLASLSGLTDQFLSKDDLLQFIVESDDGYHTKLIAGIADKTTEWFDPRTDMMSPPAYPNQQDSVYFLDHNMHLLDLYRPKDTLSWEMVVQKKSSSTLNIDIKVINNTQYEIRDVLNNRMGPDRIQINNVGTYTYYIKAISSSSSVPATNINLYPNPFNPYSSNVAEKQVCLEYDLSPGASIKWLIYNMVGQIMYSQDYAATDSQGQSGLSKKIYWDGRNMDGQLLGSGMYFYVFVVNNSVAKKGKIILWNK